MVMKRVLCAIMMLASVLILASCGGSPAVTDTSSADTYANVGSNAAATASAPPETDVPSCGVLVAYFSCTGNTASAAEKIAKLTGADLYEIVPAIPYTSDDLNYNDDNCRANREMNDPASRPEIGGEKLDISGYDTVIIGYPIWWGTAPRIIDTFLDTYDLSGKTVLPFCTSGSSGVSRSVGDIKSAAPDADVREGLRMNGADDASVESWLRAGGAVK